ncbi:hypothetical protein [Shinella zoogloeoides]|uniref:hypothetical protein n=1 Tax=Shinella zoogloeoides TaxID=352475 RepID=UPI00273E130D|nr:hypothetical protein [Shinella zoogloeoides]WLR92158.1 hypothetical protein Q9316_17075 [Shinella zoogloeoides]
MLTYFVVQSFQRGNKGMLVPDAPKEARDKRHCEQLALRLAQSSASVVAFSRSGDPEVGAWDDAVIIAQYGEDPADLLEVAY